MLILLCWDPSVVCSCQGHIFRREDLTTRGTEAPLSLRVLRDILGETVKALVDCLVIIIFLAETTMAVIDAAQEPTGPRITMVLAGLVGRCPTVSPSLRLCSTSGASRSRAPCSRPFARGVSRRVCDGRGGAGLTHCRPKM